MTSSAVHETIPFSEPDAGFVYFAQPGRWWSIHMEFHLTGRVDAERLLSAVRAACERHPMARARMAPHQEGERAYRWEIPDRVSMPELELVECREGVGYGEGVEHGEGVEYGEGGECVEGRAPWLAEARERVLRWTPSLEAAPPFKLWLVRRPEGDVLILHIHHAISDGLGVWRFVTSVFRAYAGVEDPLPPFDQLRARELRPLAVPDSRRERLRRLSRLPRVLLRSKPVRVAPAGAGGEGEGVHVLSFDEREVAVLNARRRGESTLNDVLLAGYALAIGRWNREHGARPGRISVTVPVNLRPPSWQGEVLGNIASFVPVSIRRREPDNLEALVATVTRQTQRAKRQHTAQALFDLLPAILSRLSVASKRRLGLRKPEALESLQDTAVFSNLGRLTLPDLGGEAGPVRAAWATAPAGFTRGFTAVALSLDGRLQLALRYRRAHLSDDAAAAFAELYRSVLLGEDPRRPTAEVGATPAPPACRPR